MEPVEVSLGTGTLSGIDDRGVRIFKGIPYAAPPLGVLRFAPPQAFAPWMGALDVIDFKPPSLQPISVGTVNGSVGSEDCLYLNVYAPSDARDCPVMVWIHPGGGVVGSPNECDGTSFARDGVIVVTVAYRLGVLGLLSVPGVFDEEAGANFALLDMIAALRWVRENIATFNGDPLRVTLAGVSNGGRSVATLLAAPSARGLFHQVLIMSGTGGGYIITNPDEAEIVTAALCQELAIESSKRSALRDTPALELLSAQSRVAGALPTLLAYQAVLDGVNVTQRPIDAIRSGATKQLRMLVGTNRDEFDFFATQRAYDTWTTSRQSMVTGMDQSDQARRAYRRIHPSTWSSDDIDWDVMTSSEWWIPAIRVAESHVAQGGDAWMYRLDWRIAPRGQGLGAPHGLDLPLMSPSDKFHAAMVRPAGARSAELDQILKAMHDAITRFVASGDPDVSGWSSYDAQRRATMIFDVDSSAIDDPDRALREVWTSLIP